MARKRKGGPGMSGVLRFEITMAVMVLIMAGTLGLLYLYMQKILKENIREGFSSSDVRSPEDEMRPYMSEEPPIFVSAGPSSDYSCRLIWPINGTDGKLDAYEGIGAVLNLSLENTGETELFVERVSVSTGWGIVIERTVGRYIEPSQTRWLRHILLKIGSPPPQEDLRHYSVSLTLLVGRDGTWTRVEGVAFDRAYLDVLGLRNGTGRMEVRKNWRSYFDRIVPGVERDLPELRERLNGTSLTEGIFTVQKIADAYEMVISTIEYEPDRNGDEEWLDPIACLDRGKGDCEDFAILYGAVITCIGGSARVIVTKDHAFNAVYIGRDAGVLSSLNGRYGLDIPFQVLSDSLGEWLMVEPQSFMVMGWFPLGLAPMAGEHDERYIYGYDDLTWGYIDDDPVYVVDIYIGE